jgi:lipopolysaccharide/colanic/teichoic acid biosynthesis glycosyltransferase
MRSRQRAGVHEPFNRDVISQGLFRDVLARERQRSDRSNRPFVLLCLGVETKEAGDRPSLLRKVIDALGVTKGETDIAGWLTERALIGVILSDIPGPSLASTCDGFERRLRRELAKRAGADELERLSIGFHVYPEPMRAGDSERWPMDPIFYPDLRPHRASELRYDTLKRGLDIFVSLVLLTTLSPVLLLIAALVKLGSRGPVLFRQVRVGYLARPFTMLKFRSMHTGVDDRVHRDYVSSFIKGAGQIQGSGQNGFFKLTNDRRVTPLGRLLRKTSLDELPQLWNVLRGDMSLVGPRPPIAYELEQYAPWHRRRVLEAKPGITGLWQVTKRSRTTFDEMVRLDLRYIRTRSLWTDIKILVATPAAALLGKGAY